LTSTFAQGSSSDKEQIRTYCLMCGTRCPVICTVDKGTFTKVIPDKEHPLGGTFCVKGAAAPEFVYDPMRLKYPMKRTNPKSATDPGWVRISWDEALDTIARKLVGIRERYGAESVVFYRPALGGSASADYQPWLQRLVSAFGSPNYAKTTHICNWHKDVGSKYTYGVGIPEPDYENSGSILIWGTNPNNTDIRHAVGIEKGLKNGAKLVIVDPRHIQLTPKADIHMLVRPGTDLALALGLINQVITNQLYDREFVLRWTNAPFLIRKDTQKLLTEEEISGVSQGTRYLGWDSKTRKLIAYDPKTVSYSRLDSAAQTLPTQEIEPSLDYEVTVQLIDGRSVKCVTVFKALREMVADFTPQLVAKSTGIPANLITEAARVLSASRPLSYYTYNGLEQHTDAMQINRAVCILYGLIGDFDQRGGNVIYPDIPLNAIAGFDLLPPGAREKRLGAKDRPLSPSGASMRDAAVSAYAIYEAILNEKPYPVKVFVSFGGNLIVSNGDTILGAKSLENLEFYVHVDLYENPTSKYADILLPAASSWETETIGKWEVRDIGHIQARRKVVAPEYERRGDIQIIFELAVRLGLGDKFFDGNVEKAFDYMLSPTGKNSADIRGSSMGVTFPLSPTYKKYRELDKVKKVPIGFETPTRLFEIYSSTFEKFGYDPLPRYKAPPERLRETKKFPLLLTAFKPVQFTHGSYRSIPSLRKQFPEPLSFVHPKTAKQMNVQDGDWVEIRTEMGSVKARLRCDDGIIEGVVFGQEGWWQGCEQLGIPSYNAFDSSGSNLNVIINNKLIDPVSGSVAMRGIPCTLAKTSVTA